MVIILHVFLLSLRSDSLKLEFAMLKRQTKTGPRACLGVFCVASFCQEVDVEPAMVIRPTETVGIPASVPGLFYKIKQPISTALAARMNTLALSRSTHTQKPIQASNEIFTVQINIRWCQEHSGTDPAVTHLNGCAPLDRRKM